MFSFARLFRHHGASFVIGWEGLNQQRLGVPVYMPGPEACWFARFVYLGRKFNEKFNVDALKFRVIDVHE